MATTAAIPPLAAQSFTNSQASAASSPTAETAAAKNLQPLPRSSTSYKIPRRPGRPASADYLSDKATTAFVRRTLCAQHLADRGRNTPAPIEELLPPLTSRNDVDLQLYALISVILKEFVQKWYNNITPDETFVAEIVRIIAHCTRNLEQRLRKVDLESLLLDELPDLLIAHIRAYRTAQNSPVRPPIEASPREIYHSLCPMPALSPLPKPDDAGSIQAQSLNESAYRQLLVHGVLALLLPTEDLENECLTSLVSQIFSELIIGNLVANKLSEPWLLLELFIMLTRLANGSSQSASSGEIDNAAESDNYEATSVKAYHPPERSKNASFHQLFWSLIQGGFFLFNAVRLLIHTLILSRSLPPRSTHLFVEKPNVTGHHDAEKSYQPLRDSGSLSVPRKTPIAYFKIWQCLADLLEMDTRMPWLGGMVSMLQWTTTRGPGKVAGYNGVIDRLLSHHIHTSLLDPGRLPSLLRSIRAALFPNNAPGVSSLVAPTSQEELTALRRRCASAIWAVIPRSVCRLYFGSNSLWTSPETLHCTSGLVDNVSASRSGPPNKSSKSDSMGYIAPDKSPAAGEIKGKSLEIKTSQFAGYGKSNAACVTCEDSHIEDERPSAPLPPANEEEDWILSEIESSILDIFSDPYCNKHLVYGMLELVLVRLMPELAEKGIIELWEERLS